ncbi:hypothetical protein D0T51_11480 [Parabacteroides sp. 52]|uniref:hypothetical protein n=1 Tax=unclassified Parabacteroides TaxID=2649774 RepID=UPI0013D1AA2F|nr:MULTISPECIES: hypothetical protein [unclassified Parabacteroides]NDV56346.1 hypothetical protein [Parabacteroides sp. 52]
MNLSNKLTGRIHMEDIQEILLYVEGNAKRKQELYALAFHEEEKLSYQVLWVLTHLNRQENRWLFDKQDELIDQAMQCKHAGKRRLLLSLLLKQPLSNPPRVDFLDFCLKHMISGEEPSGIQALCMKLVYALCRPIPELLQEVQTTFELMETDFLSPATRATRRNILKEIGKKKKRRN